MLLGLYTQAQPYYRVDDPESKFCSFVDTFGKPLPIGEHQKMKIAESFSEGLICVNFKKWDYQPNAWGCLNANGDTVIKGLYLEPFTFHNGVAKVMVKAISSQDEEEEVDDYLCQYINVRGELISEAFFTSSLSSDMDHRWAVVKTGKGWYILSKAGKLKNLSVDFEKAEPFSDGLSKCKRLNTYTVYCDTTSWPVIEIENENYVGTFTDGFAPYSNIKNKYGFIDKTGKPISPCLYDAVGIFKEHYAAVKIYNKWGYINEKGKMMILPNFDKAEPFVNGLALVKQDSLFGFINTDGKMVIPLTYSAARSFKHGYAAAANSKNLWGFIDSKGEWQVKPQFLSISEPDSYGFTTVEYLDKNSVKNGKILGYEKALIQLRGRLIWYSGIKPVLK